MWVRAQKVCVYVCVCGGMCRLQPLTSVLPSNQAPLDNLPHEVLGRFSLSGGGTGIPACCAGKQRKKGDSTGEERLRLFVEKFLNMT